MGMIARTFKQDTEKITADFIEGIAECYDPRLPMTPGGDEEGTEDEINAFDLSVRHWEIIRARYHSTKKICETKHREFSLSFTRYFLLSAGLCAYCGKVRGTPNGVDRIDSSKGYTFDNCVSCCFMCNQAKSDHNVDTFKLWINDVHGYQHRYDRPAENKRVFKHFSRSHKCLNSTYRYRYC